LQQYLKKDWIILFFFAFIFTIIYIIYYPPISGIEDEIGFINQAILWTHQKITLDSPFLDGKFLGDIGEHNGHFVFIRNPLKSVTLLPFIWIKQLDGMFYSSLLIHLVLTVLCGLILLHFAISPLYAIFLLLHPTLSLYSRTVMADTLAAALLLGGLFFTIKSKKYGPFLSGMLIGLASLARNHAAFALVFFSIFYFYFNLAKIDFKKGLICFSSGLCFILLAILYNFILFQSPFGLVDNVGTFHVSFFKENIGLYALALALIWPGMVIAPFFKFNKYTPLISSIALFYLLFLLFYYYHDSSNNFFKNLIIGPRLLQIALPFWCLSFILVLNRFLVKWKYFKPGLIFTATILLFANFMLFKFHDQHLRELIEYKEIISNEIPENSVILSTKTLIKLFGIPKDDTQNYAWSYFTFSAKNLDYLYDELFTKSFYFAILLKEANAFKIKCMNEFANRHRLRLIKQYKHLYIFKNPHPIQRS